MQKISETNSVDLFEYVFSNPDAIEAKTYYPIVAEESAAFANELNHELGHTNYSGLVTIGGDHSIAFASVLGILRHFNDKKVGIIDFDSHGDIHLQRTSPSGNFHGMWLRPFFEKFDDESIASVVNVKIEPQNLLYIGNMLLEEEEDRFIKEKNISVIDSKMIADDTQAIMQKITDFCNSFDVIHVTFDIDVYKKEIVSATGTPNPDGFDADMIKNCIQKIIDSKKLFSVDLVEVNPQKEHADQTIKTAQDVIQNFILGFNSN